MKTNKYSRVVLLLIVLLTGCDDQPVNSPYSHFKPDQATLYASFSERPKTLDPAQSYSSNEYLFLQQIYDPALTYSYLQRPFKLVPNTLTQLPKEIYLDENFKPISTTDQKVEYTRYEFELQKGIKFQPHPAFAKKADHSYWYYPISEQQLEDLDIETLADFKHLSTRELLASDYVYQIKRLADPYYSSPIASLMAEHIVGFKKLAKALQSARQSKQWLDLRSFAMDGLTIVDDHHYHITIRGRYPQFSYWLAMPFFAPIPWEAERFYQQAGFADRNISLSWYPVGTGAFYLAENNPNRRMLLKKNPNYRSVYYPTQGMPGDAEKGYLKYAGKRLPMYEQILFSLEKESIPRWNKFLQGYYDFSGVSNDSFDQAIAVTKTGKPILTPSMKDKKIRLTSSVQPSIFYMGFNMLDDVVGGHSKANTKLRQAISIAINYEEYISIFLNGRGEIAQSPIPPGIFGHLSGKAGINPYVYQWQAGGIQRLPIERAKQLLAEAGYPKGYSAKTGKQLILNYDTPAGNGPEEKAYFSWLRKQFAKLGVALNIRATQYNRFQQKMRTGKAQIFSWGWNADYPDPENFLFLFLSSNSKVKHHGENAANYQSKQFDDWFSQMRDLPDGEQRQKIITQMIQLLQADAPWIWGFYPKQFSLSQDWLSKTKPASIGPGSLGFLHIDSKLRQQQQSQWNQPVVWPLVVVLLILILAVLPVLWAYYQRTHQSRKRYNHA